MSLSDAERSSILEAATDRQFGKLKGWQRVELLHEFGANDLDYVDEFETELEASLTKFSAAVGQLPDGALIEMFEEISNAHRISENDWISRIVKEADVKTLSAPPKAAYGFGHPCFAVDFQYWGKMARLELDQVTALSVGANPDVLDGKKIDSLAEESENGKELWSAYEYVLRQRRILLGYFHKGGWGSNTMTTAQLKTLIDDIALEVHPEFYSVLEQRSLGARPVSAKSSDKPMTSQERDTLLKLIAAMACEQYNYDPTKERSSAVSSVRDDLATIGQTMDSKTIRKWLKESAKFVDEDYW